MDRLHSSSFMSNGFPSTSALNTNSNDSNIYTRFQQQLDSFSRSDQARNDLMQVWNSQWAPEYYSYEQVLTICQRLLQDNDELHSKVARLESDLENEQRSRRFHQDEAKKFCLMNDRTQAKTDNDPFCLALIDGDGCMFQERLLKAGADGGAEAAHLLKQEINQLLRGKGISSGCTVMVQVFLSLDALARKLAYVGILNTQGDLKAFEEGFCNAQSLFSIVDVGRGKERADHKVKEMLRLFVNNSHCKHLIFGGCHDNGYVPNLAPYSKDATVTSRLTLLETYSIAREYQSLGLDVTRFPTVFRETALPEKPEFSPPQLSPRPVMSPGANTFVPANGNVFSNSPAQKARQRSPPITLQPPIGTGKPLASATNGIKTPSPAPKTYANIGGPADTKTLDLKQTPSSHGKFVAYNIDGVRLDMPLPKAEPAAESRFQARVEKSGKLCNNYHLKGQCYNGPSCKFSHEPRLDENEKVAFRVRVRTSPCKNGPCCDDFDCYLGHNCPFGNAKCNLAKCKFDEYGVHGIDERIDRKEYEDGYVDTFRA